MCTPAGRMASTTHNMIAPRPAACCKPSNCCCCSRLVYRKTNSLGKRHQSPIAHSRQRLRCAIQGTLQRRSLSTFHPLRHAWPRSVYTAGPVPRSPCSVPGLGDFAARGTADNPTCMQSSVLSTFVNNSTESRCVRGREIAIIPPASLPRTPEQTWPPN